VNLVNRLRGSFRVVRILPAQRRIPFQPREKTVAMRDARVREIVRYAGETVPFYRELFANEGIDPREIESAEQLRQLPLIDKSVVRENPDRFRSISTEARDAIPFTTSGSSWVPLTVHHDRRSLLANIAYSERYRMVEAALVGKRILYLVVGIRDETGSGPAVDAHYRATTMRSALSRRRLISVGESVEHVLERINELRPDVLAGYGSYLEELFKLVAHRGLPMHLPRVVRYGGDAMSSEGIALIETQFGVPVLSNYNAVEAFKIGHSCELRGGFHLFEDLCDLWIAAPNSEACPPGERGEVVISNLTNRATVLLNYRLGDLARLSEEPCACGRTSALLSAVEGRVSELVHLPGGEIVHPFAFFPVLKRYRDVVTRWQIVQHEPARFELKVATAEPAEFNRIRHPLARDLSVVLGGSTVDVTSDKALERKAVKHVPVIPLRT
jgi:phenylacetate-coenzyme A ligase PaaK-like adenylate-forming protein